MFDFYEYYELSVSIENSEKINDESYRRTAVSRSYYSAYKLTDSFVKSKYGNLYVGFKGQSGHIATWRFITTNNRLKRLNIDQNGIRLLDLRKKADYKSDCKVNKLDVKFANRLSKEIIDKLNEE